MPTFDAMGFKEDILRGIYAYGFERPSAVQQRAIVPIMKGRDVIVQSQSGTGKTCVFCLGCLQCLDPKIRDPQALILSPTRELAEQSQKVCLALGDYMSVQVRNRSSHRAKEREEGERDRTQREGYPSFSSSGVVLS